MDNYIDKEQDRRLGVVEQHIATTNSEMGAIKADVKWLKWWMKLMIGSQISIIIGLAILLFK